MTWIWRPDICAAVAYLTRSMAGGNDSLGAPAGLDTAVETGPLLPSPSPEGQAAAEGPDENSSAPADSPRWRALHSTGAEGNTP